MNIMNKNLYESQLSLLKVPSILYGVERLGNLEHLTSKDMWSSQHGELLVESRRLMDLSDVISKSERVLRNRRSYIARKIQIGKKLVSVLDRRRANVRILNAYATDWSKVKASGLLQSRSPSYTVDTEMDSEILQIMSQENKTVCPSVNGYGELPALERVPTPTPSMKEVHGRMEAMDGLMAIKDITPSSSMTSGMTCAEEEELFHIRSGSSSPIGTRLVSPSRMVGSSGPPRRLFSPVIESQRISTVKVEDTCGEQLEGDLNKSSNSPRISHGLDSHLCWRCDRMGMGKQRLIGTNPRTQWMCNDCYGNVE